MFINEPIIALEDIDTEFLSDESMDAMNQMIENEINLYHEELLSEMNFWVGAAIVTGLLWYNKAALKALNAINYALTNFAKAISEFYHKLTKWFHRKYQNIENLKKILIDSKGTYTIEVKSSYPYDFRKTADRSKRFNLQAIEGVLNTTKTYGLANEPEIKAAYNKAIAGKLGVPYDGEEARDIISTYLRGPKITSPITFSKSDANYIVYNLQDIDDEANKVQGRLNILIASFKKSEQELKANKSEEEASRVRVKSTILGQVWSGYEAVKAERYNQASEISNGLQANK